MCLCFCVSAFLHDNSKRNLSRNIKYKYVLTYENNKFDIGQGHGATFYPFNKIKTVISTLLYAIKLILRVYIYLIVIYKFCQCHNV